MGRKKSPRKMVTSGAGLLTREEAAKLVGDEMARALEGTLARQFENKALSPAGLRSALKQRAARQVYGFDDPRRWNTAQDPRLRPFSRVSVETLRTLARNYDILAACIAHLKSEVVKVPLKVVAKCANDTCAETKRQVREGKTFLSVMGGLGGYGCHRSEYEALLLDDLLIIGAGCSFLEYGTVGSRNSGSPDAVTAIDAATVRPLVTAYGFAPGANEDCYEQWIQGTRVAGFKRDELIYRGLPIFARTDSPYWLSPVELLVSVVYTALKADEWNRTWLTDGNTPDWWMKMPETMSPDQIVEWLDLFDTMMAGNSAQRHKVKVTPGEPRTGNARKEADFAQFETWLMQRTCSVMGVNPASIGHHSDTYKDSQEIALQSTKTGRVAQLLAFRASHYNELLERKGLFDIEVVDDAGDKEDAKARAERHRIELESGQRTLNETRREDGLEPYEHAMADVPLLGASLVGLDSLGPRSGPVDDGVGRALRRFEKKALNRLREKGSAVCGFEDEALPAELVADIGVELSRCASRAEVRRVFEVARAGFNPFQKRDGHGRWTLGPELGGRFGGLRNDSGSAHENWEGRTASREGVLDYLHDRAKNGEPKAALVVDVDTRMVLNHAVAPHNRPHEVEIDLEKFKRTNRVEISHNHPDESPPSGEDLQALLTTPNAPTEFVVTPRFQYEISKPVGWSEGGSMPPGKAALRFLGELNLAKQRRGLKSKSPMEIGEVVFRELLEEAGQKTAEHYGIHSKKEELT